LSVIVVEPGCKVKAFKKEDGSSMIRFEMAYGKAYAALSLGRSSKLVRERAQERPIFMRYLIAASGDQIFPEGGGMLVRDERGEVIGAVGVTGDTEDRDEELAVQGIHAAGLKTDAAWAGRSACRSRDRDRRPSKLVLAKVRLKVGVIRRGWNEDWTIRSCRARRSAADAVVRRAPALRRSGRSRRNLLLARRRASRDAA
jgi:uncharacterized protein GlcG (DUF336 family)